MNVSREKIDISGTCGESTYGTKRRESGHYTSLVHNLGTQLWYIILVHNSGT